MPKLKLTVARTPEELAKALGLSASDAKEWQTQYESLKRLGNVPDSVDGDSECLRDESTARASRADCGLRRNAADANVGKAAGGR